MFRFFRKRKEKQVGHSLEEQVLTLQKLGFTFSVDDEQIIHSLLEHFDREEYVKEPYFLLLSSCDVELSNEIWNFDAECVEDEKVYDDIVGRFTQLSNGRFVLSHVESFVDFDNETARISFQHEGFKYDWEITFEHDWLDFDLLRKLAKLADSSAGSNHFYYATDGQHITLVYCGQETMNKLNGMMKHTFVLLTC